jgi:hypothetical protein
MQMALHNLTKHELIELVEQREVRIAERDRFIAERDQ